MTTQATAALPPNPEVPAQGHPRGIYTLFFTEMWERFSYYGMRALLVLFLVDTVRRGGMGLTDEVATSIYGLYTAAAYLAALPGGWVADRFLGAQRAVWHGGILIALGQFMLAFAPGAGFYLGLVVVVLGTGLLKPNVSAMVGELYPEGGTRRDAGFTIFYMGINLGAAFGPLIASALGEKLNWRYGFAAAGVGMIFGLIQYRLTARHLGEAGLRPGQSGGPTSRDRRLLGCFVGGLLLVIGLAFAGVIPVNSVKLARGTTYIIVGVAFVYFISLFLFFGLDTVEKKRVGVIGVLFVCAAMFWSGFEQAGSSLNLFADRYTQRLYFGFEVPAGWFQTLNPVYVISLAPLVAAFWVWLARRKIDPPLAVKFSSGLFLLAAGFLVMAGGSRVVAAGEKAWPTWLIVTYLLHSAGELCLSPVGLSSVTKLAPKRLVGQMMGTWFLAASLGNLIAGLVAGEFGADSVHQMAGRYLQIVMFAVGTGGLLLVFTRPIKNLMCGVK